MNSQFYELYVYKKKQTENKRNFIISFIQGDIAKQPFRKCSLPHTRHSIFFTGRVFYRNSEHL